MPPPQPPPRGAEGAHPAGKTPIYRGAARLLGSVCRVHMMSSRRLGLATQSSVRGSEAAMIMHMNCLPVLLSMG